MINPGRITKFLLRLQHLVSYLEEQRNLKLHQQVSQFYYMECIEEVLTLIEQFDKFQARMNLVNSRLEQKYEQVFHQWRNDVLWIHRCGECGTKDNFYQSLSM